MAEALTRGEIQDRLSGLAKSDPGYRAALLKDPRTVLEGHLRTPIPASLRIRAVEETADTLYVVVPHIPKRGGELEDADLELVAGGGTKGGGCDALIQFGPKPKYCSAESEMGGGTSAGKGSSGSW